MKKVSSIKKKTSERINRLRIDWQKFRGKQEEKLSKKNYFLSKKNFFMGNNELFI